MHDTNDLQTVANFIRASRSDEKNFTANDQTPAEMVEQYNGIAETNNTKDGLPAASLPEAMYIAAIEHAHLLFRACTVMAK